MYISHPITFKQIFKADREVICNSELILSCNINKIFCTQIGLLVFL